MLPSIEYRDSSPVPIAELGTPAKSFTFPDTTVIPVIRQDAATGRVTGLTVLFPVLTGMQSERLLAAVAPMKTGESSLADIQPMVDNLPEEQERKRRHEAAFDPYFSNVLDQSGNFVEVVDHEWRFQHFIRDHMNTIYNTVINDNQRYRALLPIDFQIQSNNLVPQKFQDQRSRRQQRQCRVVFEGKSLLDLEFTRDIGIFHLSKSETLATTAKMVPAASFDILEDGSVVFDLCRPPTSINNRARQMVEDTVPSEHLDSLMFPSESAHTLLGLTAIALLDTTFLDSLPKYKGYKPNAEPKRGDGNRMMRAQVLVLLQLPEHRNELLRSPVVGTIFARATQQYRQETGREMIYRIPAGSV